MERFDVASARADEDMRVSNAICKSLLLARGNLHNAIGLAKGALGDQFVGRNVERVFEQATDATLLTKGAIGATAAPTGEGPTTAMMQRTFAASVLAQLPRARRVPFRSSGRSLLVGGAADWVVPGAAIPLVRSEFASLAHDPKTVGAIAVWTNEAADVSNSDSAFVDELTSLLVVAINVKISSSDAPTTSAPAGIANAATAIASSGATAAAISKDIGDAIRIIDSAGYVADAVLASPSAAAFARLLKVADASGETIAGLRIVTGPGVVGITVLASDRVAFSVGEEIVLGASSEGDVEMADDPRADSTTPTPATTNMISLFATNSVALKAIAAVNASVVSASDSNGNKAVVSITGASFD